MAKANREGKLESTFIKQFGRKKATYLLSKYKTFPDDYFNEYTSDIIAQDINYLEMLSDAAPISVNFYEASNSEYPLHLRIYQWFKPIPLSDILPIFENFDLRTFNERPYQINTLEKTIYISDFSVHYVKSDFNINKIQHLFQEAFIKICLGLCENDSLNKLVIGALLSYKEVSILRAYTKYLQQIRFRFSQNYIEKTLVENAPIAKHLITLFLTMHNPSLNMKTITVKIEKMKNSILKDLESVVSLDEDFIIRKFLNLILSTLRTNYFLFATNTDQTYLSFKLNAKKIQDMPLPLPLYEIFVYSPRFEGLHLRNTKVARGGIRYSDRREDFRTEILGLMKAQVVKNAVIVPSGAKGGFVLKALKGDEGKERVQKEVIDCYKLFISGLLDLTDNIIENKFIRPKQVVCFDDFDPYMVVAADKGTATFSDIANSLSKNRNFWLGDAFASGGVTGYDHKKIGITARGAWESIKRHFREINIDILKNVITVVGIGDMSGDVFGNGMLYTDSMKLVAAFDHRDIFIDPEPNPTVSYQERQRLFKLPSSSWQDYNKKLISKGGGIFSRKLKSIKISSSMKKIFDISANELSPNDLIKMLLKAPVDLLYNGGIGTYVKSSVQSDLDVGDRTNDYCRVNGKELRCKVVGEGGNLGFTQLGRVEYALNGGLINTDFIDNSAGVDCSDHEVNLKILLNNEVAKKKLTEKKRNQMLTSVTDEVAALVLEDNFNQALVMSYAAYSARKNVSLHTDYIKELENIGFLDRQVEFLPDDKTLLERKAAGVGLTRPELAILLAYTKIYIKLALLKTNLPEDPFLRKDLETAFPTSLRKKYSQAMQSHRLARDIIATQISNQVVNEMGITFVYRLQMETGASVGDIVKAHAVASRIFNTHELQKVIESLDFKISINEQYDMLFNIRNLINLTTRWFLHSNYLKGDLASLIDRFSQKIKSLEELTPTLMAGFTRQYLDTLTERFQKAGLSKDIAKHIATYRAIYTTLNIIDVSEQYQLDLIKTAHVYFAAGERVNLVWFRDQISHDTREGHWNVLARLTLRDELDVAQRLITIDILKNTKSKANTDDLINNWMKLNSRALQRWDQLLNMLHAASAIDYAMFFIALRELIGLVVIARNN